MRGYCAKSYVELLKNCQRIRIAFGDSYLTVDCRLCGNDKAGYSEFSIRYFGNFFFHHFMGSSNIHSARTFGACGHIGDYRDVSSA